MKMDEMWEMLAFMMIMDEVESFMERVNSHEVILDKEEFKKGCVENWSAENND